MYHRYSVVANCLKTATQLESVLPQGLNVAKSSAAPKYVYTPIHGVTRGSASTAAQGTLYKRWQDIPDSMIPTTSKRDPYNTIYRHPKYIKFRKQQIFYQQNDGVPIYLKNGFVDYARYYFIMIGGGLTLLGCIWEWATMELRWLKK